MSDSAGDGSMRSPRGARRATRDAAGGGEKGAAQQRVIRVFISSTFRDMHAERDHLVKFIFPQLRKLCEQRGVVWGEVDLRWGSPQEPGKDNPTIRTCWQLAASKGL